MVVVAMVVCVAVAMRAAQWKDQTDGAQHQ